MRTYAFAAMRHGFFLCCRKRGCGIVKPMITSRVMTARRELLCLLIFLIGAAVAGAGEATRRFTNTDGMVIEATIQSIKGEVAVLLWKGMEVEVALAKLSETDREWLKQWQAAGEKMENAATSSAPDTTDERAGKTLTFELPGLINDMRGEPAAINVKVPTRYDPAKPVPLFIYLGGGNGGNSPGGASGLTNDDFLCVGFPYPDDGRNPAQDNMVGSFDEVWAYWEPMLKKLDEEFPNIDKRLRMIGGFSNGGHAIDGLLGETAFAEYFNAFILIDGGGSLGGKYRSSKGEHCYIAWGENSPNAVNAEEVVTRARRSGMEYVESEMKSVGHAFPESEKEKVKAWIYDVVLPGVMAGQ